jgi:hypothetical protein
MANTLTRLKNGSFQAQSGEELRAQLQTDQVLRRELVDAILLRANVRGTVALAEVPSAIDAALVFEATVLGAKVGASDKPCPLYRLTVTIGFDGTYELSGDARTQQRGAPTKTTAEGYSLASLRRALRADRDFQNQVKAAALVALNIEVSPATLKWAALTGGRENDGGGMDINVQVTDSTWATRVVRVPVTAQKQVLSGVP